MDYYKKMFKPTRPVNNEISTDIVDELESKWTDMQPKIQESVGDRSKVQKKLSEIRSYIEYCQKLEKEVSEDQQAKIRQITNKCKAALATYGNISEINPRSPGAVRKVMPVEIGDQPLQNKVDLTEVEAKLKSMRQKRLYRQSVFVEEQSKLSEERRTKSNESNEIDNAIKSIQQVGVEKKPSFKSISEEHVAESVTKVDYSNIRRNSSGSSDKSRSFSTKKFINRFNCGATKTTDSSNEDLTKEDDNRNSPSMYSKSQVLENRHDSNKTRISLRKEKLPNENRSNTTGKEPEKVTESSFQDKEELKDNCSIQRGSDTVYNPLLSPVGKQRKAIYLYENECKFLENEKQSSALGFTELQNTLKQDHPLRSPKVKPKGKIGSLYENWDVIAKTDNEKALTTFGKTNQEILGKKPDVESKGNAVPQGKIDTDERGESHTPLTTFGKNNANETGKKIDIDAKEKMGFTYKSKRLVANIHSDKSKFASSKFNEPNPQANGKNTDTSTKLTLENVTDNKHAIASENQNDENEITYENVQFKPKKSHSLTRLFIKSEKTAHRKSDDNLYRPSPLRSPLPLPRRSNDERILKKLQRNWDSLKQIVENDSDVDGDEIEDMKKTWEEANILLVEYKTKIEKLERKQHDADDGERLNEIESHLKDVGEALKCFRGLRRDTAYKQLSTRLSYCFLTANKVNSSNTEAANKKNALFREIEKHIKSLEYIVNRNEAILFEILEDQVKILGTKHFNITKV